MALHNSPTYLSSAPSGTWESAGKSCMWLARLPDKIKKRSFIACCQSRPNRPCNPPVWTCSGWLSQARDYWTCQVWQQAKSNAKVIPAIQPSFIVALATDPLTARKLRRLLETLPILDLVEVRAQRWSRSSHVARAIKRTSGVFGSG